MWVKLGNTSPKEGYRNTVNPDHFTQNELEEQCKLLNLPSDGDKTELAYLLSDYVQYKRIDSDITVVTKFSFPDDDVISEAFATVKDVYIKAHSYTLPKWVESDVDELAKLLAVEFNCQIGRPLDEGILENNLI